MRWSFYSTKTGLFAGRSFEGSPALLRLQKTPPDHAPIEGTFDPLSQRVDVAALALAEPGDHSTPADFVIEYQRPAEVIAAEQRSRRDEDARRRLKEIDLAMVRPLVQLLKDPQHAVASAAIAELEAEAAEVRADVLPTAGESERANRLRQP